MGSGYNRDNKLSLVELVLPRVGIVLALLINIRNNMMGDGIPDKVNSISEVQFV